MARAAMPSEVLIPVSERDHALGAVEPRLTLIEYGDFGCPFCFAAKRPVGSLVERYDSVRLVWRHLPDAELHRGADLAAELSEIAAVEGRFWEAHELLLAGRDRFTREDLASVTESLGLDPDDVTRKLGKRVLRARVREDVTGGMRAGVSGTPAFFFNGRRLKGHWRDLRTLVPRILAESEART